MATQSDVNDLIRRIRATKKAKVVKAGSSKHMKVLDTKGRPIVDENGPLIISGTPGDERMREMTVKRLIKAGVFTTDPYKETRGDKASQNGNGGSKTEKKKQGNSRISDPDVQEAKVRAIKAKSERLRERTAVLRGRLEPIIAKLGGWGTGGTSGVSIKEFGEVVYHWATARGRMELPKKTTRHEPITVEHVQGPAGFIKRPGSTVGEKWLPLFEVFVDELERNTGSPVNHERAAQRYRELLRESKGISDGPSSPAPLPPPPVVPPVEEEKGGVGPMYDQVKTPTTTLRALWYMARGATSESERDDILSVADELADLELNCKQRR